VCLDVPTLSTVFKVLFLQASDDPPLLVAGMIKQLLWEQQAVAQQMRGDAVVDLLHVAIASRAAIIARPLVDSPVGQQLGVAAMLELLSAAVDELASDIYEGNVGLVRYGVRLMCILPAARQLTTADVAQRLQTAAEACDIRMVCALLHLPAAQQLSDGDAMLVLRAAENSGDDSAWRTVLMC
jgi:hypothetical protein